MKIKLINKLKFPRLGRLQALAMLLVFQFAYIFLPVSGFINFLKTPVAYAANNNGMAVYQDGANNVPKYRNWDGSAYGTQQTDTVTTAATMQWMVVKEAPARTEKIMATMSSTGDLYAQVKSNGSAWAIGTSAPANGLYGNVGTTNDGMRGFDIAYEQVSSDLIFVYEKNNTSDASIYYRVWNGSSWGAEQTLTYSTGTNGAILWVNMVAKPLTNEIMLVTANDAADNTPEIRGIVWDGDSWEDEQLLTDAGSVELNRNFDTEWEASSGDALVVYGTGTTIDYWTYSGGTWTDGTGGGTCAETGTGAACINPGAAVHNIELSSSRTTDDIVLIGVDAGQDVWAQSWSGSGWRANPSAIATWDEAGIEFTTTITMQPVDAAYEAAGNRFLFTFIDNGGLTMDYFFFDLDDNGWKAGDGTTSLTDIDSATAGPANLFADDGSTIQMAANPEDNSQIMFITNDLLIDIRAFLWNGSSWTTPTNNILTGAHGGTAQWFQPFYFTWDVDITAHTIGTSGSQNSSLPITGTDRHVGGAFTAVHNSTSQNITSITISETGTVNANSNLSNLKLWYKQEATCSATIPGDATQFNGSAGTFNGSDQSTVTGTMSVGTSQVCIYVSLNIGAGASGGQTVEIQITDPSTQVTSAADVVTPSTAVAIAGTSTLADPSLTVSTEDTQKDEMGIPSDDNNVGGSFTFTRNVGSVNVTSIKINEEGTVDADLELSNVKVYYKEEADCDDLVVPEDATLFNSTPGSFNAADEVTVTGTMAVDTDKTCVYVRVNVLTTTEDGDTLEIEITNPSTDVVVSAQTVTPATVVAIAGTTDLVDPTFVSYGSPFLYTEANWGTGSGLEFNFEIYWRKTVGNVYARVYDETAAAPVTDSLVYISSSSFVRTRTDVLTLTDGHVYRAQLGATSTGAGEAYGAKLVGSTAGGGADLAEFYQSPDRLELGEVVAIDPAKTASVVRSTKAYQKDAIGIVSTKPGMILGMNVGQSYPIALSGRVPVKASTENGVIKKGDRVTAASVAGHAMKATYAGRVLGQALEDFDPAQAADCPPGSAKPGVTCGSVMVFVNLSDYSGQSMNEIASSIAVPVPSGMEFGDGTPIGATQPQSLPGMDVAGSPATDQTKAAYDAQLAKSQHILDYLKQLTSDSGLSSEIFTGQLSAAERVITPQVVADEIIVRRIKAGQIEGLSLLVNSITTGGSASANITAPATIQAYSIDGLISDGKLDFSKAKSLFSDVQAVNLLVLARLESRGGLEVSGQAEFKGRALFRLLAQFYGPAEFKDDLAVEGTLTQNQDAGGIALVKAGDKKVAIKFSKLYAQPPVIVASWAMGDTKNPEGQVVDPAEAKQTRLIEGGYQFAVTNVSEKGFVIILNRPAAEDIELNWLAAAIKDAKISPSY